MLAALRSAVASVSSELAEKNAVTRILAEHGHRRPPSVITQRDANGVTRVYLWADAGIALVTGPSLQGTVYEVRAVPADAQPTAFDLFIPGERGRTAYASGGAKRATVNPRPAASARPTVPARAPLVQAPRRIGAAPTPQPPTRRPVLTRHNPADPKPPPVSPLPAAGIPASFSTDTFKALPPNPVWAEGGGVDAIAAGLKKTGAKPGGGLEGGVYTDTQTGLKYLVKFPPDAQMVGSEVLAAHLYRALGIYAPDMRRGIVDSKPAILSPWVDGLKKFATSAASWQANVPAMEKKWLAASLPADVWLANYDVVGLEWDNLLALPDGHAIRIDPGASLMFRAGGQLKSPLPTMNAGVELDTMLFKPKGDKIQFAFADAAADPSLMLPMADNIAQYMKPGYIDAVAKWAGYTMKTGLGQLTIGDYLYERAQTLLTALLAKTGTATAPQVVTSSVAPTTFSLKVLASRIANLVPGATFSTFYGIAGVEVATPAGTARASLAVKMGYVKMDVTVAGSSVGTTSFALPSPITSATYDTLAQAFADEFKAFLADGGDDGDDVDVDEEDEEEGFDLSALPQASSVTLLNALPEGSVVCDEEGDTLLHKDENGLWRELTEGGMMLPGKFAGSAFTALGSPIYLLVKGDGEGLAPGDKAGLKALWKQAQAVLTGAAAAPTTALASAGEEPEATLLADALAAALQAQKVLAVKVGQNRVRVTKGMANAEFDVEVFEPEEDGGPFPVELTGRVIGKPSLAASIASFDYTTLANATTSMVFAAIGYLGKHGFAPGPAAAAPAASVFVTPPVMTPAPTPIAAPVATPFTPVPLGATPGFTPFAYSLPLDPVWDTVGDWYAFLLRIGKAPMGPKLGSFPGGKVTDPQTGAAFYIKAFSVMEHAQTEALACRLYRLLGLNAPDVRIINNGSMLGTSTFAGKTVLISPWQNGYEEVPNGAWSLNEKEALATTFAVDVWMANYDVVGKGPGTPYDNLLRGTAYPLTSPLHYLRVDQGAALDYRSTGSTKKSGNDWGTNATWTWKNFLSDAHPTIKKVFGLATYESNGPAISRIANLMLKDNVITVFEDFGRDDLFDVLMERAMSLANALKKTGGVAQAPAPAPSAAAAKTLDATGKVKTPPAGAPPPMPMTVGTVTDNVAQLDALPIGTVLLLGFQSPTGGSMAVAPVLKAPAGWASKALDGTTLGAPQPSLTGLVSAGLAWSALILRESESDTPIAFVFKMLQAALPNGAWSILPKGTAAAALLAWFANSPFAAPPFSGKAAAAAAPAAAALPPGMAWVSPPFTSANIKSLATAYTGNDYLDPGSVIARYYTDGERAFFQRVTNYDVRKLDASTGQYAGYAKMLVTSFTSSSGADTMAILYLGDADPAMDDPDAMAELLAQAPPSAVGAPNYTPPTPVSLYETYTPTPTPTPEPEPVVAAKPKKGAPGTQEIKTLTATTLKTLAPLVAKAVKSVAEAEIAGPLELRWQNTTTRVKVGSISKTGDVTLTAFRKGELVASKPVTLPLPDTANSLASELAKQMVYFLAYVHETKGREVEKAPADPPTVTTVGGVALVPGATITTVTQAYALPADALLSPESEGVYLAEVYAPKSAPLPATLRYLPVENWDTYYQPLTNTPKELAYAGVVVPQPKAPGWPPVTVAPTLALYSSLPIGSLIRSDVNQGTVWAARTASGDYQKVDASTGVVMASTPRPPSKLVMDAASSGAAVRVVYVGKGTVEPPQVYLPWLTGSDAAASQPEVTAASVAAQVTTLATALGISPAIAALFTPQALQAMLAHKGVPYAGASFIPPLSAAAKSPLLLKNPGGFRSNPGRFRDVVRTVLRNPNPTMRDLQDAELLDAAGLPLHECLPLRRNPKGGLATANAQETGVIKGVADALKALLGDGPRPKTGNVVTSTIDARASTMYGSGGGKARAEQNQFAQFLRYLVAARSLGLWKKFIDPGERSVTRALEIDAAAANAGNGSIRAGETTLSQIEVMKAAGALSVPTKMTQAMNVWLTRQASGNGWTRTDVGQPWMPSSSLTPPATYPGKLMSVPQGQENAKTFQHWNIFQAAEAMTFPSYSKKDTYAGPLPYPKWAGKPWANVEGFAIDYYDSTYEKYTISEWSAPLWGYGPSPSMFYMRANTRDPRFVMLPGSSVSEGPMSNFRSEGAVLFCTVDDKPLKAEVVSMGKTVGGGYDFPRLTDEQLVAWGLARPAFPSGPKPTASSGPSFALPMKTNPTRVNGREVHAILFSRAKWGPGAVRSWLAKHGMEGLNVEAAGGAWRVSVYAADAFHPGSIQRRAVADGVVVLAGRPL